MYTFLRSDSYFLFGSLPKLFLLPFIFDSYVWVCHINQNIDMKTVSAGRLAECECWIHP